MKISTLYRALFASLLIAIPAVLHAQIPAVETANLNGNTGNVTGFGGSGTGSNLGWSFQIGAQQATLLELGIYDYGSDGLANSYQVGIWNSSGTLLAQATVDAGTTDPLSGGYRYVAISPTTLAPQGTYTIGALYKPNDTDLFIFNSTQTYAPDITYLSSRQTAVSSMPTFGDPTLNAGLSQGIFGPNFVFAVPEPTSFVFLALGVGLLGLFRWQHRLGAR